MVINFLTNIFKFIFFIMFLGCYDTSSQKTLLNEHPFNEDISCNVNSPQCNIINDSLIPETLNGKKLKSNIFDLTKSGSNELILKSKSSPSVIKKLKIDFISFNKKYGYTVPDGKENVDQNFNYIIDDVEKLIDKSSFIEPIKLLLRVYSHNKYKMLYESDVDLSKNYAINSFQVILCLSSNIIFEKVGLDEYEFYVNDLKKMLRIIDKRISQKDPIKYDFYSNKIDYSKNDDGTFNCEHLLK